MNLNAYDFWRFAHILLFVYWLGADLGVYYAAKYINRADLSLAERKRFLELTLLLDMGPRTGLVLLMPVGFQLWFMSPLVEPPAMLLWPIWIFGLAWLALVWLTHKRKGTPLGERLRALDIITRWIVIAVMGALGVASLFQSDAFFANWLALKIILYACVIVTGLYLRKILHDFGAGFQMLEDGKDADEANALIAAASPKGERGALLLWFLIALIAYLGVAKPF